MSRVVLLVLVFGFTIYALIDCARADESQIKNLPKWGWLLAILFTGIFGPIAYLTIGRIRGPKGPKPGKKRILPPDDDPDFLRGL